MRSWNEKEQKKCTKCVKCIPGHAHIEGCKYFLTWNVWTPSKWMKVWRVFWNENKTSNQLILDTTIHSLHLTNSNLSNWQKKQFYFLFSKLFIQLRSFSFAHVMSAFQLKTRKKSCFLFSQVFAAWELFREKK